MFISQRKRETKLTFFAVYGHTLYSTVRNWFSSERWDFCWDSCCWSLWMFLGIVHCMFWLVCQMSADADSSVVWLSRPVFICCVCYMCKDLCYSASCLLYQVAVCWAWSLVYLVTTDCCWNCLFFFPLCSCPVPGSESTLEVLKNGQGPEAMFRIQMFKFVGSSYTDVFLHCNVQICPSPGGVCQPVRIIVKFKILQSPKKRTYFDDYCILSNY